MINETVAGELAMGNAKNSLMWKGERNVQYPVWRHDRLRINLVQNEQENMQLN